MAETTVAATTSTRKGVVMPQTRPLAVVTGGSSGIGLELAVQCAGHGYDVAISGSSDKVTSAAERLRGLGVDAFPHKADASTYEGVESFWQFVVDLDRPVDVAVLNVGIGLGGAFVDTDLEAELRLIAINCSGTVHFAKRVVQHMVPRGEGRILFVSSVSATTPTPYETVYGPSKAFGFSFAESLREELRDSGVTVTALLPGATDSVFHANAGMGDTVYGDDSWKNDKTQVAAQGFAALMAGDDHVVGGDEKTKREVADNRTTPEPEKARAMADRVRGS